MNHPRRLLLLVPLALLGAALLVRTHLPLSATAAQAEVRGPVSNTVTVAVATPQPIKPRVTTPKRKPQPPVSANLWLRQREAKTMLLYIGRPYYADDDKKAMTGLRDTEAVEISNRVSIHLLLRALHASTPFSKFDENGSNQFLDLYTDAQWAALYVKNRRYYLGRGYDAAALEPRSVTQFLRALREVVRKGRRKQRGYSVHLTGP